jgi:hypothetical protein
LDEISRAHWSSRGFFFLSLQGTRCSSFRPLPLIISQESYDRVLSVHNDGNQSLQQGNNKSNPHTNLLKLFHDWYVLDTNTIPPSYVIRTVVAISDGYFWNSPNSVVSQLCQLFSNIELQMKPYFKAHNTTTPPNHPSLLINRSYTEWEIIHALSFQSSHRCLCSIKYDPCTNSSLMNVSGSNYGQCVPTTSYVDDQSHLLNLMNESIPVENAFRYAQTTSSNSG